jgi:predicted HD phosphohydrolase
MGMGEHSVGRVGHEMIGEEYLRGLGFADRVSRLVGSHVAAKRYLTQGPYRLREALTINVRKLPSGFEILTDIIDT